MSNFIYEVVNHVQRFVPISDITLKFISLSIMLMAFVYLYHIFFNPQLYERNIALAGILVRALMLAALSLELLHHMSTYPITGPYKESSLERLASFITFGYVLVVGTYDILTIHTKRWRGFFHTFDIAVISIPLFDAFALLLVETIRSMPRPDIYILVSWLMLIIIGLLYFVFFQLYWRQEKKWYAVLFALSGILVLIAKKGNLSFIFGIALFFFLLGLYEASRIGFSKLSGRIDLTAVKKYRLSLITIPLVILLAANPFFNVWSLAETSERNYEVKEYYNENADMITLEEAENIARRAVDDYRSKLYMVPRFTENFNNIYIFYIGDYNVNVTNMITSRFDVHSNTGLQHPVSKNRLSTDEIKNKTVEYIKKQGFTYDPSLLDIKIESGEDSYSVNIYHKFSDGTLKTDFPASQIQWTGDGKLIGFSSGFFNIKDNKNIKIDYRQIDTIINNLYKKLGSNMQPYAVTDYVGQYRSDNPTLEVVSKNGDRLRINAQTGDFAGFSAGSIPSPDSINIDYKKGREIALALGEKLLEKNIETYEKESENNRGVYTLQYDVKGTKRYVSVHLDSNGNLISFQHVGIYNPDDVKADKGKINISRQSAIKIVEDKYSAFGIYNKKAVLARVIDKGGKEHLSWMVVVIPYKSSEHQIYFVDTLTGKIKPLESYKAGVKSE